MNILHIIRDLSPETGGPVSALHGLSAKQKQLGHKVCIVSTDYGLNRELLQQEGDIILSRTLKTWRFAPKLKDILKRKIAWCDIVHIHTIWEYPTLAAVQLARKIQKPFLLRTCGMLEEWSLSQSRMKKNIYLTLFAKTLFNPPCLLHFTTQAELEKSIIPGNPDYVVIQNGISQQALDNNPQFPFLNSFPELSGKEIVLFLGRIHPKKRPDIAIIAFANVASQFPNAILVFAGPYAVKYREYLTTLAQDYKIRERIKFTGMLKGNILYGAYRAASIFILPSMQENFGIAVAEANLEDILRLFI